MRARTLAVATALLLGACTRDATVPEVPAPGDVFRTVTVRDVLLLGTDSGPVGVEAATGSVLFGPREGVVSPDGSRLYRAVHQERGTTLDTLDAATGAVLARAQLRGRLQVRVASGSGKSVALMKPLPRGIDLGAPIPRSNTTLVVADPTGERDARRYRLTGNFEPEAFATDDSSLFLIEHLPPESPTAYRVTALDLSSGELRPVRGKYDAPPERMAGIRLSHVYSPDGTQLYTLYSNQPPDYAAGSSVHGPDDRPVTFIHVLNLVRGWAHCAGVPAEFWGRPANAQTMAVSPDGAWLYIVDAGIGRVAAMDTRTLEIVRTGDFPVTSEDHARASAGVSPDGSNLFVASTATVSTVLAIDTSTFRMNQRWTVDGAVAGLGFSSDGRRLYLALVDRLAMVDPANGDELVSVPFSGVDSILHVVDA